MPSEYKAILALVAVALFAALLRAVNLKRAVRGRQFLSAVLSPVVACGGVVGALVWFRGYEPDEESLLWGAEPFVWNLFILAAFLVLKLVLLPVMSRMWSKEARMEATSGAWYEFDPDLRRWFLKSRMRDMRMLIDAFAWVITAFSAVVLAVGLAAGPESELLLRVFPCAAMLVFTEASNFLGGMTKEEFCHDIGGEDSSANRIEAYYKLRKVYEDLFPQALLSAHTGNEFAGRPGAVETVDRMLASEDAKERLAGRFFSNLEKKTGLFDVDLINGANGMLHGESQVILNPFYRDLEEYLLLPVLDTLLQNKRCLVVVGRSALEKDVTHWMGDLLRRYSHTRGLWRVSSLSVHRPEAEVGVLTFAQLYNADVINANTAFFQETGFVLFIEPSHMLVTSQPGLSLLAQRFDEQQRPVYCICDHSVDGLVDTMSHLLQTNLTHVAAPPAPHSVYTGMAWAAAGDFMRQKLFDKQTHYLGNGVELAAVALKNQIAHITWYSAEKAPVEDIRWLAGQYYPQICRYAHMPSRQSSLEENITFSSNLWGGKQKPAAFVIAEDELCNLFATMRTYLTRGSEQSFVNVISENYLLRDYMRYNRQLFMTDPKAVPAIAPYYARTQRNTVLRLILMMACAPVREDYIAHELGLLGCTGDDLCRQLTALIRKYTFVEDAIVTVQVGQELDKDLVPVSVCSYSVTRQRFEENFASTLKNAFFVVEDEKFNTQCIDARLFEHITQSVMPGQQLVYDGKLYRVHALSPEVGCILHRAADSYRGRTYYRQLREYCFGEECTPLNSRKVADVEIAREERSFKVTTRGYLAMSDPQDLRSAKHVDLSNDPAIRVMDREYKHKTVLRIRLPETDEATRFTVCLLLGEMFRSVFPDAWPYLAVLCTRADGEEGMLDRLVYRLSGNADENMIYVVEDSDMDLGLLEAVDNNLLRFFEILADYLEWHFEKIHEPPAKDPVLPPIEVPDGEKEKRRSFLAGIAHRLRRIFGVEERPAAEAAPTPVEETPTEEQVMPTEEQAAPTEEATAAAGAEVSPFEEDEANGAADEQAEEGLVEGEGLPAAELDEGFQLHEQPQEEQEAAQEQPTMPQEQPEPGAGEESGEISQWLPEEEQVIVHADGEDLFSADGVGDDLDLLMPIEPSRYQKECFLKFGFDEIDGRLAIEELRGYLNARGWGNNDLTRARERTELPETFLDTNAENQCDFCGMPLNGVSYDRLSDGRTRCNDCSRSAINTVEEFTKLFRNIELMMENTYGINFRTPIEVRTADARTIARHTGQVFRPSKEVTARVLGFASRKNGEFKLFIENGSPRLAAADTLCHEMTHIWQYLNWNEGEIERIYRQRDRKLTRLARDIVYEGMAMWSSIQLLYSMGELEYARRQELSALMREDIYGEGFKIYLRRYDMIRSGEEPAATPFRSFPPVDPEEVTQALMNLL